MCPAYSRSVYIVFLTALTNPPRRSLPPLPPRQPKPSPAPPTAKSSPCTSFRPRSSSLAVDGKRGRRGNIRRFDLPATEERAERETEPRVRGQRREGGRSRGGARRTGVDRGRRAEKMHSANDRGHWSQAIGCSDSGEGFRVADAGFWSVFTFRGSALARLVGRRSWGRKRSRRETGKGRGRREEGGGRRRRTDERRSDGVQVDLFGMEGNGEGADEA